MTVEIDNHDGVFQIIEMAKSKNIFPDTQQATKFALGLKLFTEVVLASINNQTFLALEKPNMHHLINETIVSFLRIMYLS